MPSRVAGLLVERTETELLVLVPNTNEVHALNESAAIVFDRCDGTTTPEAMVEALAAAGLPADRAIVDLALAELSDAALIVDDPAEPPRTISRRSVIRSAGLSAAAIAMLPIVETIVMQPAAAQTSPGPAPGAPVVPGLAPLPPAPPAPPFQTFPPDSPIFIIPLIFPAGTP